MVRNFLGTKRINKFISTIIVVILPLFFYGQNVIYQKKQIDDHTVCALGNNELNDSYVNFLSDKNELIDSIFIGQTKTDQFIEIGTAGVDSASYEFIIIAVEKFGEDITVIPDNSVKIFKAWLFDPKLKISYEIDPKKLIRINDGYYFN